MVVSESLVGNTDIIDVDVVERVQPALDVVRLTFARTDGGEFPEWEPGAHIDILLDDDTVRQYSLCGDPARRDALTVAVLREAAGRGGSARVHDELVEGVRTRLRGPRNHFPLAAAPRYVFIAGGIGITPIMAMLRSMAATAPDAWQLFYGGRTLASMAFAEDLTAEFGERVTLVPQDVAGLLDLAGVVADAGDAAIYACGPEPMLVALEEVCARADRPAPHLERFAPKEIDDSDNRDFVVEIVSTGQQFPVEANTSVLDTLLANGISIPFSCTEGTCGTCETGVLGGDIEHRDSILTEDEQAVGDVMFVCVSRCRSAVLKLDL